jgi:glyceraldehyde-3-phosphate dehydrogenase (NADP+)
VAHKLAPAIAAGCPVLLKPSPQAPLSSFALAHVLLEAGLPPEHLSIVPASNDVASPLVRDDRLRMLTFTGSARVGWALRAQCGEKRCTLELGGNAAVIVHDDADLARAADRIAVGAHGYAGQSCISVQRVYAHRKVHDELRARLLERQAKLVVGDPSRDDAVSGPVIDDVAVKRIRATIEEATAQGARASGTIEIDRRVFRPILLENVAETSRAMTEEIFAPVAILSPYDDFEDALARVDASRWGLQAGLFTRDVDRVMRTFERLEVGAVIHDDVPTFRADAMPYGGVKSSGLGREGPAYAFEEMTERRLLLLRGGDRRSSVG